jgi:hypothetical protein
VDGLAFVNFDEADVVRHHLVQRIVRAYDEHKSRTTEQQIPLLAENREAERTAIHERAASTEERAAPSDSRE